MSRGVLTIIAESDPDPGLLIHQAFHCSPSFLVGRDFKMLVVTVSRLSIIQRWGCLCFGFYTVSILSSQAPSAPPHPRLLTPQAPPASPYWIFTNQLVILMRGKRITKSWLCLSLFCCLVVFGWFSVPPPPHFTLHLSMLGHLLLTFLWWKDFTVSVFRFMMLDS